MLKSDGLRRVTTFAAGLVLAALVVLWVVRPAEAAFPGANGLIVFASNMTTGTGVNNPTGDYEIFTMTPEGASVTQLTTNTAFDFAPAWSPDGTQIAFQTDRDGDYEVYTMDANGDNQTNISNDDAAFDFAPAWSPNGQKIAFCNDQVVPPFNTDVYKMDTNPATDDAIQLTDDDAWDCEPAWSPNGKKIAFTSQRGDGDLDIYVMSASGSNEALRTKSPDDDKQPSWSPNGRKIAFVSNRIDPSVNQSDLEIYVMNADGTRQRNRTKNTAADHNPAFSPDGKRIVYVSETDFEIYTMNSDGSNQTNRTNNTAYDDSPDWQPLR